MTVPPWVWVATVAALLLVLALDLAVAHRPREVGVREALGWTAGYVGLAAAFAAGLALLAGPEPATQFVAGYLTEYSLSVDNLFVFLLIMTSFAVPKVHERRTLLVGIVVALVLRGACIAVGGAVIARFGWVFYLFGAFLLVTAVRVLRSTDDDQEYGENALLRLLRRAVPITADYPGARLFVRRDGRWWVTPLLFAMIAIGTTDLVFALDSIPAVFGLTSVTYLVFTATAFALLGLRQLYFLLGGLLNRLHHLPIGLGLVLGFIGVKLILEALAGNTVPFVAHGAPVPVPVPGTALSLSVVAGVLAVTVVASLVHGRRRPAARASADRE